ncbi:DUF4998 domain-containing protein [Flavobacterium sp. RS13.1]|uniref:DUF4998 domain-containing protein n=1 Tax=Flavobacterium sp. RS13.1 TaxID=3400345 RepID=UPI003AAE4A8C
MKNLRNILIAVFIGFSIFFINSCTSGDEYLKFTEGGEISYTGKIDSLKILPGRNRLEVQGLIMSDPKVKELRIYWNNKKDSAVVPIIRTSGIDAVTKIINNLEENIYNFEFRTFDAKGNSSIPVNASAEVYGDRYISSLINRPVLNYSLVESNLKVNYVNLNTDSGALGTEIEYTSSSDELKTIFTDISKTNVVINDFKSGSTYRYRTLYKPVPKAIDTFYSAYKEVKPVLTPVLLNTKQPFAYSSYDGGRWGVLAGWTTNAAAKNHNGYGGYDGGCCGKANNATVNFESGWGSPGITNGKMYQTVTVVPATYQLKVTVFESNHEQNDPGGFYIIVSKGNVELPNVESVTTNTEVLKYKRVLSNGIGNTEYILEFTVDQTTPITVGITTSQPDWGRFCTISSFEILAK